jgi:hypothetical protein
MLHFFALQARGPHAENQAIPISYRAAFLFSRDKPLFGDRKKT